jgi:predicted acetyltransferase
MNKFKIKTQLVHEGNITASEKVAIQKLQKECFDDVPKESIEEDFIAESFAKIFAYNGSDIVGMLSLKKRNITFAGKSIVLGGIGGVCVAGNMRGKGIATQMLKNGLEVLKKEKCDIACLNVDLKKEAYKLYEKAGFTMMERPISFENSKGEIKHDTGTMFIPLCSKAIYDFIMNSKETFHYGKGYW